AVRFFNYFFTKEDGSCFDDTTIESLGGNMAITSKYVSTIATNGRTMVFTWNNSRQDLTGGKSLAEINVKDLSNNYIKKLRFEYTYFKGPGCDSQICKRLRLDRIYDLSPEPLYVFNYYQGENLPARNSNSIDYLGLYNSYTGIDWIPYHSPQYGGASRVPNALKMRAD